MRTLALLIFGAAFSVAGLVVFALVWSGTAPYADLARDNHVTVTTFVGRDGKPVSVAPSAALEVHQRWSGYVTGGAAEAPVFDGNIPFTEDEYAHMADVRRVFDAAKFTVPAALFVILVRLQRARVAGAAAMWQLVRGGAIGSAVLVALIGVIAVVAFEPLFLAFHHLFFPQGNFLFDPATSNLIRLYPDWYWEGISLRVGISFLGVALALAAVAQLRVRGAK